MTGKEYAFNGNLLNEVVDSEHRPDTRSFLEKTWNTYCEYATSFEDKFNEVVFPIVSGVVLLNPILGVTNDVYTLCNSEDIYGNKASTNDKTIATVDFFTFGFGVCVKNVITAGKIIKATETTGRLVNAGEISEKINNVTTYYSVYSTVKSNSQK